MYGATVFEEFKKGKLVSIRINSDTFYPCSKWQHLKDHYGNYQFLWLKQKRIWFHKFKVLRGLDLACSQNIFISSEYENLALQFMDGKFRILKRLNKKIEGSKYL